MVFESARRPYLVAVILLAVAPPLIAATFVTGPDRWDLFERSGTITTTIGLLLGSRRYLRPGIIEIAMTSQGRGSGAELVEFVEDIHATKLGMAISAFGTIIWGWGKYLQWWTFGYLVIWSGIAAFDAWRDFIRLRDGRIGEPLA